ncbi:hypothetical protein BD324DRAFT_613641 [Kockovaella imperatae]|uniref:Nucleotide-diphospho-sugar transferase n=1 Tax=Kockovaella imperatae TaxID=4999 RepID=A0A1Y1UT64_9TREE|nr:hypothetical protein BD324DRAFT_613641 [Kockovaella imperatae]ORX41208.1 hypothetical protein BD324DRAFT_613641 [Kockovaella imperatae]
MFHPAASVLPSAIASSSSSSSSTSASTSSRPHSPPFHSTRLSMSGASRPHDVEKMSSGPKTTSWHSPSSSLNNLGAGIAAKGLRRRRLTTQALGAVFLIITLTLWYKGVKVPARPSLNFFPAAAPSSYEGSTPSSSSQSSETAADGVAESHKSSNRPDTTPLTPLQSWGKDLRSDRLLAGLDPWPAEPVDDPDTPALSTLGKFADNVYDAGHQDLANYTFQLRQFAEIATSGSVSTDLLQGIARTLEGDTASDFAHTTWDSRKKLWQTAKDQKLDSSRDVKTWREGKATTEGWDWQLLTDEGANSYVESKLGGSRVEMLWNDLPTGILRSDLLRYLLLLFEGGIYSDTDTSLLKEPSRWGSGATVWKYGEGWLDEKTKRRLAGGEDVNDVLGPPSVVVGIEADVGTRADWAKWWPRPIQIVQWTMASAPFHPISLSAVLRVMHKTAKAIDWAHEHEKIIKILNDQGRYKDAKELREVTVMNEPKSGGPLGVMSWTGPGIWTDAVMSYLKVKYGVVWTDLRSITVPLRIGDVVVLPVTGFSPGVGNFGAKWAWDEQAMVEHKFKGSWKTSEHPK